MNVEYNIDKENNVLELNPSENGMKVVWKDANFTVKPLSNFVVVKKDEQQEKSKGGIYLPDAVKEKPATAFVVSVGDGLYNEQTNTVKPMTVQVGDRVLLLKNAGSDIMINDIKYTVLRETEILGII